MTTAAATTSGHQRAAHRRWLRLLLAGGPDNDLGANIVLLVGAGLMVWSAVIHLRLWASGYRELPTIGPLFLLQGIVGIVLAVVLVVLRRVWCAVLSFGLVVATVGGFLISVSGGLFGFQDSWISPDAVLAFAVEVAAAAVLAAGAVWSAVRGRWRIRGDLPADDGPAGGGAAG